MIEINKIDQFNDLLDSKDITVVVFTTNWCPDCHFIDSFMDEVLDSFKDKLSAFIIDKDQFPKIAEKYSVNGIPSFVAFKNGKVIDSFISKKRKSRKEIEDFLEAIE